MIKKTTLIFLLIFLLLISVVSAAKTTTISSTQTFSGATGLQIEFPNFMFGKVSTAFSFPFHVYSLETGLAITNNNTCFLHVFDVVGNHIFNSNKSVTTGAYDYTFSINDSVFSTVGDYRFLVYCECVSCAIDNSSLGGFSEHVFEINKVGSNPYKFDGVVWLAVILAFILSAFAFLYISFNVTFKILGLKILFFLMGIVNVFITLFSVYALILNPGRVDLFSPVGIGLFSVYGIILIVIIYLYGVHLMKQTMKFRGDE